MTRIVVFVLCLFMSSFAVANNSDISGDVLGGQAYQEVVKRLGPGLKIQSHRESSMPGYDELIVNSQVVLVSKDGRYIILGPVMDMEKGNNGSQVGADFVKYHRSDILDDIDQKTLITYKPDTVKAKVKIFTDINCYYCRKLHADMNTLLSEGIEVSYLSFPVSGGRDKKGSGYSKAVSVWCSDDPNTLMTKAKLGENIDDKSCDHSPIDKHFKIAMDLNINATPTIVFEDGHIERGYLPPLELAKMAIIHNKRGEQ